MTPLSLPAFHGTGHFLSPGAFPEVAQWLPTKGFGLENFIGAYLRLAGGTTFADLARAGFKIGGWKPKSLLPRLLDRLSAHWRKSAAC